jgi:hypothetical protein
VISRAKLLRALLAIAWMTAPVYAQPAATWEIRVPERVEIAQGASATVPITIAVDRGFSVSKDGPVIIDVASEPGVTIKKRRLGRPDAVDPEADLPRFVIPVRADAFGDHAVRLRIRLWLCGGKVCRPLDVKRQTTVVVAAPAPVDPPTP